MPFPDRTEQFNQRALSIRQPWAELILSGRKTIEIRTWSTTYRGPLWLHAGRKQNIELDRYFHLDNLFHGGFVGQVVLSSVLRLDKVRWERWKRQHLSEGPMPPEVYGWILREPIRFAQPLPAPGSLGLFSPPPESERALREAMLRQGRR
jgi:hypothetical protein